VRTTVQTSSLASRIVRRALGATVESPIASDPVLFAQQLGFDPDPWQADMLRAEGNVLLNCCRQSGKSTGAAVLALHTALVKARALVLCLSPSQRQSGELFRKVLDFYGETDIDADSETRLTMDLPNKSRIVSLPGKEATIRGYSGAALIIIDEAARVPDELYMAVRPMLAVSGGRLAAMSTPWGKRGWWHDEWTSGEDWIRFEVPATQCPRIPPAFLEKERRSMGEWWFNQEYMCTFEDAETAAFSYEDVQAAFEGEVELWNL
jgi:hypothetical protein